MEIQFQPNQKPKLPTKAKNSRNKTTASTANKFIGVRQRPSGRWVAEIKDTTHKIRMWLGTFETAEEAARAYDEGACLLRGSKTRTNFATTVSPNSALASRIKTLLNSKKTKDSKPKKQLESSSSSSLSLSSSSSSSLSSSPSSPSTSPSDSGRVFDDVYKPDLSGCRSGGDDHGSWGFDHVPDRFCFAQELLELPKNVSDTDMSEFERMKVERQISASLYAINGLHEYMEAVYDPTEAFWDLPPLSPLLS